MLFHSPGFLFLFLPLVLAVLRLAPSGRPKRLLLVLFSYLFYSGSEPFFCCLLLLSSSIDYFVALKLYEATDARKRKVLLSLSVLTNLSLLGFYKYGLMLLSVLRPVEDALGLTLLSPDIYKTFILPAGISFYTFQSMSYSIDVYRRQIKPEQSFLNFLSYVAFLPQLIAGPIERFKNLSPELDNFGRGEAKPRFLEGVNRFALGVCQKLLIADGCGRIVDELLATPAPYTLVESWSIAIGFGMQIYFDFAAYTHMAIGIALMLGVKLSENFLSPYKAKNVKDFWRRWHVTLSTWFRDYVYIPLGGSRSHGMRTAFNLLLTFLVSGLWHGAGWNFIAWGALHGVYVGVLHLRDSYSPKLVAPKFLGLVGTFALVHFAWVFFRVDDLAHIQNIWLSMCNGDFLVGRTTIPDTLFLVFATALTLFFPNASERKPGKSGVCESGLLWVVALFAILTTPEVHQFIYFQF